MLIVVAAAAADRVRVPARWTAKQDYGCVTKIRSLKAVEGVDLAIAADNALKHG